MMHDMTDQELAAIEARMRALPMWTRPPHLLQDVPALVAEVRRLQAEVARMHLNTTTETRAEWADPT